MRKYIIIAFLFMAIAVNASNSALEDRIVTAGTTYRPYLNLTDNSHSLVDLSDKEILNKYSVANITSIYVKIDKLILDDDCAEQIKKLSVAGIKEILIFYNNKQDINTDKFNEFLLKSKIYIHLMLAPTPDNNNDILYFNDIKSVSLLNNKKSANIILQNYIDVKRRVYNYTQVTDYSDEGDEIQDKDPQIEISATMQKQVSVSASANINTEIKQEQKKEVDIDEEQRENKFNKNEALAQTVKLAHKLFLGSYVYKLKDDNLIKYQLAIERIFSSFPNMQFISSKALDVTMRNVNLFMNGINAWNLPEGFAYTDGILFLSSERSSSMKTNAFTIKLNPVGAYYDNNPSAFSWLPFATKANTTLAKIYGVDEKAPFLFCKEQHPGIKQQDDKLDVPQNLFYRHYAWEKIKDEYAASFYSEDNIADFWQDAYAEEKKQYLNYFPKIYFYNLSNKDLITLKSIYDSLHKRNIDKIFLKLITVQDRDIDGEFLLEEKTEVFLQKLFYNIFPENISKNKQDFFLKILNNDNYSNDYYIEDVFEGLDEFYERLQVIMQHEEVTPDNQAIIIDYVIKIVSKQFLHYWSFRVILERLINMLELVDYRAGSILEQLENLRQDNGSILISPSMYWQMNKRQVNTVHEIQDHFYENSHEQVTHKKLLDEFSIFSDSFAPPSYAFLSDTAIYLASLPAYQRASVISYKDLLYVDSGYPNAFPARSNWCNAEGPYSFGKPPSINRLYSTFYEIYNFDRSYANNLTFEELKNYLANSTKKVEKKYQCHSEVSIVVQDANLVSDYTQLQVDNNLRLLELAMLTSSGEFYDRKNPTQDFDQLVSFFNVLFTDVRVYHDIKWATGKDAAYYNPNTKLSATKRGMQQLETDDVKEMQQKERLHGEIIQRFIVLHKRCPKLNFIQLVSLGLANNLNANFATDKLDNLIDKFNKLSQYHESFTQLLRALLALPAKKNKYDLNELQDRGKNIARIINYLSKEISYNGEVKSAHAIITNNYKFPSNLVLFALTFGQEKNISDSDIARFMERITKFDKFILEELLASVENIALPYANGTIVKNNLPILKLSDWDSKQSIANKIKLANQSKRNLEREQEKTKFNHVSLSAIQQTLLDFSELQDVYGLDLTLPLYVKSIRYIELLDNIIHNPKLFYSIFAKKYADSETVKKLNFLVAQKAFANFVVNKASFSNILNILYDEQKTIDDQFIVLDQNFVLLKKVLEKFNISDLQQEVFYSIMSGTPNEQHISSSNCLRLFAYLYRLDQTKLQQKNLTILKILQAAGHNVLVNYLPIFEAITTQYITNDIAIELGDLYKFVIMLEQAGYNIDNVNTIINYCIENSYYGMIKYLAGIDGGADHIPMLIKFVTSLPVEQIKIMTESLQDNCLSLFAIRDISKIKVILDIIIKRKDAINKELYAKLIKNIAFNNIGNANILKSYLFIDSIDFNTTVKTVATNLDSPENMKVLFSRFIPERFNYDPQIVKNMIKEVYNKNTITTDKNKLCDAETLYSAFVNVMQQAKEYRTWTIEELKTKAQTLKRQRMHINQMKNYDIQLLDLSFIAVSVEVLYRCTSKFPRYTQILYTIFIALDASNCIEEIATGEGKSITTALQAAYLNYTGQTVDVTSSSKELAERDLKDFSYFYTNLGLIVAPSLIFSTSETRADLTIYKKYGINYSTSYNMALFKANMNFYSNTHDLGLHTNVSLISDEVDFTLTSAVDFKLAIQLAETNQEEARALYTNILDFLKEPCKKTVNNLVTYLSNKFIKAGCQYPIGPKNLEIIRQTNEPLYHLNNALLKIEHDKDLIFQTLLGAVNSATKLKEGVDYTILQENLDNYDRASNKLLMAVPYSQSHPQKGSVFGAGVQGFLHILIERSGKYPNKKFDISLPTYTVFNISPKTFFDSYSLANGRVIGLTGTAGDVERFRSLNRLMSFNLPGYNKNIRVDAEYMANNASAQFSMMLDVIKKQRKSKQPIVIFADNTLEAEKIYGQLKKTELGRLSSLQLFAFSRLDTDNDKRVLAQAGEENRITIVTPANGRGTDFYTEYKFGFLGINLCTNTTPSGRLQIYGRVARDGRPGTMISIFNKEISGSDIKKYQNQLARLDEMEGLRNASLSDVLSYLNLKIRDDQNTAVKYTSFVFDEWRKLVKGKQVENKQQYLEIRTQLINILKNYSSDIMDDIDEYMHILDTNITKQNDECYSFYRSQDYIGRNAEESIFTTTNNIKKIDIQHANARADFIDQVQVLDDKDREKYTKFIQDQNIIMATHIFDLPNQDGEGSNGDLMLNAFKQYFNCYKRYTKTNDLKSLNNFVDLYKNINAIDVDKLPLGGYQPINIVTKFAEGYHAESILTNGKLLFWLNRGAGSKDEPGIRIFKITKDSKTVGGILNALKGSNAENDVRNGIYTLLRPDNSTIVPKYIHVKMPAQTIGNCGWTQTEGMLKAMAIANELTLQNVDLTQNNLYAEAADVKKEKKLTESQQWQNILKKSEDIYKDFTGFHKILWLEMALYSMDKNFKPRILDAVECAKIDARRNFIIENPVSYKLLEQLTQKINENKQDFVATIYEKSFKNILRVMELAVALDSDMGKYLQSKHGRKEAENRLKKYQLNDNNKFAALYELYKKDKVLIL